MLGIHMVLTAVHSLYRCFVDPSSSSTIHVSQEEEEEEEAAA